MTDISFGDLTAHVLTTARETDGRHDLVDATMAPGAATPLHLHTRYEERLWVLEGSFVALVGGERRELGPGDFLTIPLHTPHAITSPEGGRALMISSPAGFVELLERTGSPADAPTPPDLAQFAQVAAELGDELLAPPAPIPAA